MEAFLLPTDFVVVTSVVKIAVLFSLRFEKRTFWFYCSIVSKCT